MKTKEKSMLANITDLLKEANKLLESINKSEISRIEREFKNEDFHIKVWETEEEIGAETIFVREGFRKRGGIGIEKKFNTLFFCTCLPDFGMKNTTRKIKKSKIEGYTFQDIIEDLEKAHNKSLKAHSKEVTIKDVIKELGNVDTVTERLEILSKYEVRCILSNGTLSTWHSLRDNFGMLEPQLFYELGFYGVRRKEVKQ